MTSLEEAIEWSGKPMSAREFMEAFRHRLPVVVRLSRSISLDTDSLQLSTQQQEKLQQQLQLRRRSTGSGGTGGTGSYVDFIFPPCQNERCLTSLELPSETPANSEADKSESIVSCATKSIILFSASFWHWH